MDGAARRAREGRGVRLGKWKTILQMAGLSLMMYRHDLFGLPIYEMGVVLLVVAAVLTLWSMVQLPAGRLAELRRDGPA